jgi:thiamine biosynthesis protein ThiI
LFDTVIVRFGELTLKSDRIRRKFLDILKRNIFHFLEGLDFQIREERGRFFVDTESIEDVSNRLSKIFGIVSVSPAAKIRADLDKIADFCVKVAKIHNFSGKSFAVRVVKRLGEHDFSSMDLANIVGERILNTLPDATVDLGNPDFEVFIEVRDNDAYVFMEKIEGLGGLPLGSEGRLVSLFSGGIDSPVAAFLMMKRGCFCNLLYFDNSPFTDETTFKRALDTTKVLKQYAPRIRLYVVKHGESLENFIKNAPRWFTCILCKRLMYKVAEKVCLKTGAKGIVTGESIGQVASQTLENISVINQATNLPILRPLIGLDKREIEDIARKIGTYEPSHKRVRSCSAFPQGPALHAKLDEIVKAEDKLCIEKMVEETFKTLQEIEIP